MSAPECVSCGRPVGDSAKVCGNCAFKVFAELRTVDDVVADLLVSLTRQDRIGDRDGPRSTEPPLPWREPASEATWVLHSVLLAWARTLATGDIDCDQTSTVELAKWLLRRKETLRHHEDAGVAIDEIVNAVHLARRTVDRPPVLAYRGPCDDCGRDMYVAPAAAQVTCQGCERTYDAAERRAFLVRKMERQLATAADIARAVSGLLGEPLSVDRIYQWKSRGRILPRGVDRAGRPLYAVGDVVRLVTGSDSVAS